MEACAGAHHMARQLTTVGHQVKLISPQFVKPFVKANKNDFIDAEAICEAASRPSMRFVLPKTEAQQVLGACHRIRESLVRDRVKTSNQIHGFLLEFGISLPIGPGVTRRLPSVLAEHRLPARLIVLLEQLHAHYKYLEKQIDEIEKEIAMQLKDDHLGTRLMTVPGIGLPRPVCYPRNWAMASSTPVDGTSSQVSGWCQDSTALAVRRPYLVSASAATRQSDACWCSAPASTWRGCTRRTDGWRNGQAPC